VGGRGPVPYTRKPRKGKARVGGRGRGKNRGAEAGGGGYVGAHSLVTPHQRRSQGVPVPGPHQVAAVSHEYCIARFTQQ